MSSPHSERVLAENVDPYSPPPSPFFSEIASGFFASPLNLDESGYTLSSGTSEQAPRNTNQPISPKLSSLAEKGDVEAVQEFLRTSTLLDVLFPSGLDGSCRQGHADIVKALVHAGATPIVKTATDIEVTIDEFYDLVLYLAVVYTRNQDQVLTRYGRRLNRKTSAARPHLIPAPQVWCWKIGTKLIFSCPKSVNEYLRPLCSEPQTEDPDILIGRPLSRVFSKAIAATAEEVKRIVLIKLDLKQKHATMRETHAATVMSPDIVGFIIIIIIFTPLSFMTSLFALPVDQFQPNEGDRYITAYLGRWMAVSEITSLVDTVIAIYIASEFFSA
ncbi:hypothetical protein F4824DRAFT_499841 [Ustulina deusta]|nr:hypothetical protein F4824DRAFT_499841 [Ustulina deusta]